MRVALVDNGSSTASMTALPPVKPVIGLGVIALAVAVGAPAVVVAALAAIAVIIAMVSGGLWLTRAMPAIKSTAKAGS